MPEFVTTLIYPLSGAAVGILIGLMIRAWILPRLAGLASSTDNHVDDIVLSAARGPVVLWAMLIGGYIGVSLAGYDEQVMEATRRPLIAIVILSVSWTVGQIGAAVVRLPPAASGAALPSARILSTAIQIGVLVVGFLVALQTVGISVTPILTALGVGGLAIGLALQDTLANLFAGFHILVSGQLRPGDFVQIASGQQGFIEDITWRNTTIRQLPNNLVIVPNAELAKSITVNFSLPEAEQNIVVDVGVSYDEDLQRVERVTLDVATSVQREVEGAVRGFEPAVRFKTFGDSSVNFYVVLRGSQFTDKFPIRSEFVKRLHARFAAEGITIPFPQRVVHMAKSEGPAS